MLFKKTSYDLLIFSQEVLFINYFVVSVSVGLKLAST